MLHKKNSHSLLIFLNKCSQKETCHLWSRTTIQPVLHIPFSTPSAPEELLLSILMSPATEGGSPFRHHQNNPMGSKKVLLHWQTPSLKKYVKVYLSPLMGHGLVCQVISTVGKCLHKSFLPGSPPLTKVPASASCTHLLLPPPTMWENIPSNV